MIRLISFIAVISLSLAACGQKPAGAEKSDSGMIAVQNSATPDITVKKILKDVVGKSVQITDAADTGQVQQWTFDEKEYRQVQILEQHKSKDGYEVTVYATTGNNPGPKEDAIEASGKLLLQYQFKKGEWTLTGIENLSFKFSIGQSA